MIETGITFGGQYFRIFKTMERMVSAPHPPSPVVLLPMPIPWFKLEIVCSNQVPVELNISNRGAFY